MCRFLPVPVHDLDAIIAGRGEIFYLIIYHLMLAVILLEHGEKLDDI
jgi:hypothetical protein